MRISVLSILVLLLTVTGGPGAAESAWLEPPLKEENSSTMEQQQSRGGMIVYTAHQGWLSRIYLMRLDGTVIDYHEYEFYFFAGLEVIDNEVYVSEAFAPRVFRLDLATGGLDLIIDDWTLYYFYNLAFDGTYFYLNEWDLNRYTIDGDKMGTASYAGDVYGSAWDGNYLWNLDEDGVIRCWDVSAWPAITEVIENAFSPPSASCRGLWFDGQHFWTAESIDETLGYIFKFDYDGGVVAQWLQPAFSGWGACVVEVNYPPDAATAPSPEHGAVAVSVSTGLSWFCSDPDGDPLVYDIYLDSLQPPALISSQQPAESFQPATELRYSTTYYWRVVAWDNHGDSTAGPLWSFTTEAAFLCGDADGNELINISDAVYLVSFIFGGGLPPDPLRSGDVDCSDLVNISDAVYLIAYIFAGGPEPCAACP